MSDAIQYRKILLLTDLTAKSQTALGYAREFAQFYNAYLGILHVLPPPNAYAASPVEDERDAAHAVAVRSRLETLVRALRAEGISVQVRLCRGEATAQTILKNIRTMRPDLVIQGTAAIDDLRRPFLGSIAEEVLRSAGKPVLTVPGNLKLPASRSLRLDRILLATNFGSAFRTTAQYALSFAEEFGSRVYLCHVHAPDANDTRTAGEVSASVETELQRFLSPSVSESCDPRIVVRSGKPAETILELAASEKCDLIVLGAYTPGPLGSRGRPGTVFRVIAGAHCPVLTVPSAKRRTQSKTSEQIEFIEV